MTDEMAALLAQKDKLIDLIVALRESDMSDEDFNTKVKLLNREIMKIDKAMRNTSIAELDAAARALNKKTLAASNNVLKRVLAGLEAEVQDFADGKTEIKREMEAPDSTLEPVMAPTPLLDDAAMDDPVLLRQTHGTREIYGHLVREMQVGLHQLGFAPQGFDMIFGPDTAQSLTTWRAATGQDSSEEILTSANWKALTEKPVPDLFDICAQATAAFEGHGFGTIAGDFDGAVLTWGYHGYTLKYDHLQAVLSAIVAESPAALEAAFGAERAASVTAMLAMPNADQQRWARDNVMDNNKKVRRDWFEQFAALGGLEVAREAQLARSRSYFWQGMALPHAKKMGLVEPLSLGMLFDAAIQQGGAAGTTIDKVNAARASNPDITEMDLRKVLAKALTAQIGEGRFRNDVAARRKTFITGRGRVHGATYDFGFWGFFAQADENENNVLDAFMPSPVEQADPPASFEAFFASRVKPIAPNFSAKELLAKGGSNSVGKCKGLNADPPQELWENCIELARALQAIREKAGVEVRINSCYRAPAYNKCIGGKPASQHLQFKAADITIKDGGSARSWHKLVLGLRNQGVFKGGIGLYSNFVHVDVRGKNADWVG